MASRRQVRYQPLAADERNNDSSGEEKETDLRYDYTPKFCKKIPWKSIALAFFLLALGSVLLFLSFFVFAGHMAGDQSQAYAFLLLGILAFLPVSMQAFHFIAPSPFNYTQSLYHDHDIKSNGYTRATCLTISLAYEA